MDQQLSTEQSMLKDAVERLLRDAYGFQQRDAYLQDARGWSQTVWSSFAELGLFALPFAEEDGGLGAGAMETMLVSQALGRALALEPYWSSVVLCGALLRTGASAAQRARWLPAMVSGQQVFALAHMEPLVHHELHRVDCRASRVDGQWVLEGRKSLALGGDVADWLLVTARVDGPSDAAEGLAVFMVEANTPGVRRQPCRTQDGRGAADVVLTQVRVAEESVLGTPGQGWEVLEPAFDQANAALCAETLGVMESMLELTLEYMKTRHQFGVSLSTFQSVQHKLADMHAAVEQSRGMVLLATQTCTHPDAQERRRAVSGAKAFVARAARRVGQHAIQLHGGIGLTEECKVGHDFRRAGTMAMLLGDASYHTQRVADTGGFIRL